MLNQIKLRVTLKLLANIKRSAFCTANELSFKPKYTKDEQERILTTLNEYKAEELSKFDISGGRIKHLQAWRNKNGSFHTLSEVLEVEGLGEKILERLCNSILNDKKQEETTSTIKKNSALMKKQFVAPALNKEILAHLESVVGLHISSIGVSWAKLNRIDNQVNTWDYISSHNLPKKMLPSDTFEFAFKIFNSLPSADLYVMESLSSNMNMNSMKNSPYHSHLELSSMLLALINSRQMRETIESEENQCLPENKVVFLKQYSSSKMFKTFVGNERVSSVETVFNLLENKTNDLPCEPIVVDDDVKQVFFSESAVYKELLGQGLLLSICFMELCVKRNLESINAISNRKTR